MKYSVAVKFLALVLCAAMLFGALASAFAIFCLNEAGLYRQSYDDAYSEYLGSILQSAADSIAARYAAQELGRLNEQMMDDYFGGNWHLNQFAFGKMAYILKDEAGNALQTYTMTGSYPELEVIKVMIAPAEYPKVERTMTLEEWNVINGDTAPKAEPYIAMGESTFYDAVPPEGATVTNITVGYGDSSEGVGSPDGLGTIFHNANGHVEFRADMGGILDVSRRSELTSIRFENDELGLLCEITSPKGVGILYTTEDGYPIFCSNEPNPDYVPEETVTAAPAMEAPSPVPPTAELIPRALQLDGANIYDIPSETGIVVGTMTTEDAQLTFRAFQVEGRTWLLCEKGWILAGEALSDAAPGEPPAANAAPEEKATEEQIVFTQDTPVYSIPNKDSDPFGILTAGMVVTPIRTVSVAGEKWVLISEGWLYFPQEVTEEVTPESSVPVETELPQPIETEMAQPTETEFTEPAEETVPEETGIPMPAFDLALRYYDRESKQEMMALCSMAQAPAYTVDFTLAQGALEGDYVWSLLGFAYQFRSRLLPVLLGCTVVFALMAVYLCCAAGHLPGVQEIRAGGLNRLPLDGWLVLWLMGLTAAALLGVEGSEYLLRGSMAVGTAFAAALAYGGCLLTVCFLFACAAQFKTPGGFWWKNSLCGLVLRGVKICWGWLRRAFGWMARVIRRYGIPYTRRLLVAFWKFIRVLAVMAWDAGNRIWQWTRKQCRRLWAAFLVFWQQLPMTWQWLLAGFAMIILLALTVSTRLSFWGICGAIALILYAAHAFGILLGGVKRMNKGDLNNKVDDKLLIGCFREFAGELNGLADVAVVAAQKQLKSERMKTELITNVSHDIKTPLTSIINYVDLLEKPHTPEEQTVYLEVLNRQSQRLKKLVEDLMEMSKASTGNMSVDITYVDAVEAVNQALGEFADKLDKAQLIPVFRHPEEPITMQADGRLVWRVLSNLLGNAVKYALPGTRIYLDLNRVEDKVILSLKNISRQELNITADELLERFVRGDVSRNTEGSGLGLNIAKSLMELQKGSLQLLVDGDLFKVTLIFPAER